MGFAKQQQFETLGHNIALRSLANFYNIFNDLTLTPITNGNGNPAADRILNLWQAQSANAGRVVNFHARFTF
jgi:hypothetical protein